MIPKRPKSIIGYMGREEDFMEALIETLQQTLKDAEDAGWSEFDTLGALFTMIHDRIAAGDTRSEIEIADIVNKQSTMH